MTLNEQIVEEAKNWAGIPYQHRSWTKNGCDCTGLLIGIMKAIGIGPNYEIRKYPIDWCLHGMADNHVVKELMKLATPISKSATKAGDVLIFKWGRCESHVGIKIKDDLFLHTRMNDISRFSKISSPMFFKRWVASFRFDEERLKGLR